MILDPRDQTQVRFMPSRSATGYNATAKALHWLVVALLCVQFAVAWSMPHIGRNTRPETLINLHFTLGTIVLLVAIVRWIWRLRYGAPSSPPGMARWQAIAASLVHWLLYLLIVVVPLLGWINASWRGFPVYLFGIEMPKLIGTRVPGWGWTGDTHGFLAYYVMLALVALHVGAALWHFVAKDDGVMQRMLPARWVR